MGWFAVLALLTVAACGASAKERRLLIRDIPADSPKCLNTAQGQRLLADSKGFVCTREQADYSTGCCKQGQQHTCDMCKLSDRCCAEYEHCVSCCLVPEHDANKLYAKTLRAPKNPSAGTWPSAWEYCRGICRTHGQSTSHENAYISSRHHCFSTLGRPMLSDPLPMGALTGVTLLMGNMAESCVDACARKGEVCSASHLLVINSCDRLREMVGCEAGCEPGKLPGGAGPAYLDPGAPKQARPAMCFVQPQSDVAALTCTGKDPHARRLCACKPRR